MAILNFIIHLAGATMLLLFAVRMVRTGIERSYGASFQRLLTRQRTQLHSSLVGVLLAIVLQSSAAVALLVAGFSASGLLSFATGLAIVIGGDFGSALIIQVLSFRLDWLIPLLLTAGGWLFVKTDQKRWRQSGRVLMGIAFILISLRFLREAMDPIRDSEFLPAVAGYLANDYITAFIVGATLAFVMHSSVAAILMCVTLVQIGAIPFDAGLSLVLGANLGSAVIPVWLSRGMSVEARRVPMANLALRGSGAIVALMTINFLFRTGVLGQFESAQALINAHLLFNFSLVLLALPFGERLEDAVVRFMPAPPVEEADATLSEPGSVLDKKVIGVPSLAISGLKRELLRMIGIVERMFVPMLTLYESGDRRQIKAVRAMDDQVNTCLSSIRSYGASIPTDAFSKSEGKTVRSMVEYAIRLETAGDVVAKRLTELAEDKQKLRVKFSPDGWNELVRMHEGILANLKLASNVLISDDLESARLLMLEKAEVKQAEYESRKRHLKRLQSGTTESFETSDLHLETLRAFREFNSHISAVAYPILYLNGQLLETRLIEEMEQSDVAE